MKREIKFRAWDKKNNRFENIPDCTVAGGKILRLSDNIGQFVWQQFTGFKDKNDKEIYEGDILEIIYINTPNGFTPPGIEKKIIKVYGEVVFDFSCFNLKYKNTENNKNRYVSLDSCFKNPKEIIGNIFENPNLINQKTL